MGNKSLKEFFFLKIEFRVVLEICIDIYLFMKKKSVISDYRIIFVWLYCELFEFFGCIWYRFVWIVVKCDLCLVIKA